jgi:autotransporter-associated beta strand protein
VLCTAQTRTDNRRLSYTGSAGAVWDNSAASWMTTGSYLTCANVNAESDTWAATAALPDTAIFDSTSDAPSGGPAGIRTIAIASGGVTASDVVVSGLGSFVFTGGAITADPAALAPGSVQFTGTGTGLSAGAVTPSGRLVKIGTGVLTLSNTTANRFAGGIHLLGGVLSVTDRHALGDNNLVTAYFTGAGGAEDFHGSFIGEKLINQIQVPGLPNGGIVLPAAVLDAGGRLLSYTRRSLPRRA